MADKPLYYGSSKASGPMYYSGKGPMYYGGRQNPMYYGGGPKYGGAYGAYGSYGSYGGYGGEVDDGSLVGTITMSRMLRVVSQRWLSVFVFLLVGLIVRSRKINGLERHYVTIGIIVDNREKLRQIRIKYIPERFASAEIIKAPYVL